MARKKIVFVIVEGPSDETALGVLLTRILNRNEVHIEVMHCDITTQDNARPTDMERKICSIVKEYLRCNAYYKKGDLKEIIHITDTDGAYIQAQHIIECKEAPDPIYHDACIQTCNPDGIVKRNQQKSQNLNKLFTTSSIWNGIPYQIYYMSCNLDHVLYNKRNSSNADKEKDAYLFVKKYKNDLQGFVHLMTTSDVCVQTTFRESWEYITKECHSLERHSNFGLYIKQNIEGKNT